MKKPEQNLNLFFKKNQKAMTFTALPFVALGILIHHTPLGSLLSDPKPVMTFVFLAAALLCGLPIAFRAYAAHKFKTVSIEMLVTIAVIGALIIGEYSECGIVTFLFQFGSYLEAKTLSKTRSALKELAAFAPQTALRLIDKGNTGNQAEGFGFLNAYDEINAADVEENDRLIVLEGGKVAVDGTILTGSGCFNEAGITGESGVILKSPGDFLYAGSILESGLVTMRADRVGEDTTYARIIELVEEAGDARSPVDRFIDRFARYYTPFVILAAALTLLFTRKIDTSVTVLVLACPGALVIGAPIASISGIGRGAKNGILFKGGDVMHTFARCDTFLFDKTGTLTYGDMRVSDCIDYPIEKTSRNAFLSRENCLRLTASMEEKSSHPLGKAIKSFVSGQSLSSDGYNLTPDTFKGLGMKARFQDYDILVGNEKLFREEGISLPEPVKADFNRLSRDGKSIVLMGLKKDVEESAAIALIFGICDRVKTEAADALSQLKKLNKARTVMLTGDHAAAAAIAGKDLDLDEIRADLLPEDKYAILSAYQEKGKRVCFVGDGINDSPSITKADTGIAMGSGTDVAIECSDIVILKSDLGQIPMALKLSRKTVLITMENILIAVTTVILLLTGLFCGYIHMSSGMLIHELSILLVILNGMRLLIWKD